MPPYAAVSNRCGIIQATLWSCLQQMRYYICHPMKRSPRDVLLYIPPCEAVSNRCGIIHAALWSSLQQMCTCHPVKQSPTDRYFTCHFKKQCGIIHAALWSSLQQMWYYTCCIVKQSPTDVVLYMPPCEAVSNRYISPAHHKLHSPSSSIIAELHCLSFRIPSCSALSVTPGQEIVTFLAPGTSPRFQCHFLSVFPYPTACP